MLTKQEIIDLVMKPVIEAGYDIYFVGGCVRDTCLGKKPHDYDLTTNATPEQLHTIFERFSNVSDNSEAFGVTMPLIKCGDGRSEEVEIATFRRDTSSGRRPSVDVNGVSIKEDAARRDFTINALYERVCGAIEDPTGQGLDDIRGNTLRFCGRAQDRIEEDPLRALRLIRFVSKLGFDFKSDEEFKVLSLDGVSKERILKELVDMFGEPYFVSKGLPLMLKLGIDKLIPGLHEMFEDMKTCYQNPKWHAEGATIRFSYRNKIPSAVPPGIFMTDPGIKTCSGQEYVEKYYNNPEYTTNILKVEKCGTVYDHTLLVMEEMAKQEHDYLDIFSALLHDIGKPESARKNGKKNPEDAWGKTKDHDVVGEPLAYEFCKNLGMTNEDCDTIAWLVKHHMRAHQLTDIKSKCKIWRMTSHPLFSRLVKLAGADENGCRKTAEDEWQGIRTAISRPDIAELIGVPMPARLLTGDDLISKGYTPGPLFKKALDRAYQGQIDEDITDKEVLYKKFAKGILKRN